MVQHRVDDRDVTYAVWGTEEGLLLKVQAELCSLSPVCPDQSKQHVGYPASQVRRNTT